MIRNQLFNPKIVSNQVLPKQDMQKAFCCYPHRLIICYDQISKIPIPLKNVHYFLKVQSGFVIVELQQNYSTQGYEDPIELEYLFSIDQNAVVTKLNVQLGDTKVCGIVKEKQEAQDEYEEGVKQGKTMVYSEQDEQYPEIKRVKIGALAPEKQLTIIFEYIQPLDVYLNTFWKVEVPLMIDQQYFKVDNQQRDSYFEKVNMHIQQYVIIKTFEYNFQQNINVSINMGSPITYYKCPTHQVQSQNEYAKQMIDEENPKILNLMLSDTPSNFIPSKQFTLLFSSDDINLPRAFLSHTMNDALSAYKYCATLTFIPKFNQVSLDDAYSQYLAGQNIAENLEISRGNYLFFIDRSRSMLGSRIQKAKQSLILFLKSLPENCKFNIISFGSVFKLLWAEPRQYSQDTLEEAITHVNNMKANMNGTVILKPLQEVVYDQSYGNSTTTTLNVFLLTDGQVDALPIIDLVKRNNQAETRIYTIGIGEQCSQYLIKRLAEVGNGKFQFVTDDEDINTKIIDLLEDSLTPYLKAFNIESNLTNITQIIPDPESIVCLKKNQELTIQVLFSDEQIIDDLQFTLSCFDSLDWKQMKYSVALKLKQSQENEYFHKLASHKFITYYYNSLNYGENHINFIKLNKQTLDEQDIVNTSIQYQIISPKTAFICEVCDLEDQFKQLVKQKVQFTKITLNQQILQKKISNLKIQNESLQQPQYSQNCLASNLICFEERYQCNEKKKRQRSRSREKEFEPQHKQVIFRYEKNYTRQKQSKSLKQENQFNKIEFEILISCAQANGSFQCNEQAEQQLNVDGLKNDQNYPQNVWHTLLALLYLEKYCSENKKSWQLIYNKGIQYLLRNGINYKQVKEIYLLKKQEGI